MNRRLRDFIVKLFSLVLAIIMCIPTNVYALGIDETEEEYPTIMTEDDNTIDSEENPIIEEEKAYPKLETEASLNEANDAIIYKVKLTGLSKENETRLSLGLNKNQDLKSLAVREVKDLDTGDSIDFEEGKDEERKDLVSLSVNTIDTQNLEYTIEAKIDKDNIDDKKFYSMDISVDNGEENILLERTSHKFIEEESKEDPEVKELVLSKVKASADDLKKISIKKNEEDNKDYITYSDYIISKEKSSDPDDSNREITYNISIDENQDPSTAEIALEYYKASETGFTIQKEFSTKIPYQEETKIDLPAGYLLKITYTNQVDPKNTKAKSYSVNNREVKNPHFVKEENKSTKEDDPLPEDTKNKSTEDKKTTEKADEEKSEDKKDVANKSSKENKDQENKKAEKQPQEKSAKKSEKKAETKEDANLSDKKSIDKKSNDTKTPTEEKTNKNGLSPSQSKKAVADFEEELDKQIKDTSDEKGSKGVLNTIKNVFGLSDLQKADRKLKAALKDESNGLVEIQNLLTSLGNEYNLSRSDQARLLADNEDAIKALIEKDANINFDPSLLFGANETTTSNLEDKKFTIRTRFDTSTRQGPIKAGQYFNIHLDEKLTVKDPSSLEDIIYKGNVIARPSYDKASNTIKYQIVRDIDEDINKLLNIDVDYNPANITPGESFTVVNRISGLGVTNPKALPAEKIDKNGNPAGTIVEKGRDDVVQVIDEDGGDYKVNMDAYGTPQVKDGQMQGVNWNVRISSTTDLKALGFKLNLTTVKGSGLGEIQDLKLNGKPIDLDDQLQDELGIVDSKHHDLSQNGQDLVYSFYTPITEKQSSYMLDISVLLKSKNKTGAVRLIQKEGYPQEKIEKETPNRVGINNRTTILGEFTSDTSAKWTITDGVSSGDTNIGLPLESRKLTGDQTIRSGKRAVYGLDEEGKMVVKEEEKPISSISAKETDPQGSQPVGNIAVYELDTNLNNDLGKANISGVEISKGEDLLIDQHWNLPENYNKMPAQDIEIKDKAGKPLGKTRVGEQEGKTRLIRVPDVKSWTIDKNGKASPIPYDVVQTFPERPISIGEKSYNYNENTSYYNYDQKNHYVLNSLIEIDNKKPASFKLVKVDSETGERLEGAHFDLLGSGVEVVTDENGEANFTNIYPGSYKLNETKAPNGYKLNSDITNIDISDDGEIRVSGSDAQYTLGSGKTETIADDSYPDYMNAMHYGRVNSEGKLEFYIYLKALDQRYGGQTDRDTRLNLNIPGVEISDVAVYDVGNNQRPTIRSAMENQNVDEYIRNLGPNVLNSNHSYKITGQANVTDSYTGKTGYQIKFPKERFGNYWGFLVKVTAEMGDDSSKSVSYDWLTEKDTQYNGKIRQIFNVNRNKEESGIPTITVSNTPFVKKPIEVFKFADTTTKEGKRKRLDGAEFVLKDSQGNILANKITDENGKADFGLYPEGKYTIEEVQAPDGYEKNGVYFEVTVNKDQEVTYKAHFENSLATPQPGQDYFIEKGEEIGSTSKDIVESVVKQSLGYNEGQSYSRGERPNVWEAYRYESLKYHLELSLKSSQPGERFEIQFDRNLDFTQYFSEFPKLKIDGVEVADPYFDYNTNLLTYVFNEKSKGGPTTAKVDLVGMIPSKYYAKSNGSYPFTITVEPGKNVGGDQTINKSIEAFYDGYDSGHDQPVQSYYFREVYEKDGDYYVDVISYYNVLGDRNPFIRVPQKTLTYNWLTTRFQGGNIANWVGTGQDPLYKLDDVKIYRTDPKVRSYQDNLTNENMPISMGVRPEQDPSVYQKVFSSSINPEGTETISQNGITLTYDKNQINPNGKLLDNKIHPLTIKMPRITNGEGYVIEQRFKITDIDAFDNSWRAFAMSNGNLKSVFASGANKNKASGDQTSSEAPKYYKEDVGLINREYTPGKFSIIKKNEDDRSKTLKGATFELTDSEGRKTYRISGEDGRLTFTNLAPDKYTLKETRAPKDFIKSNKQWEVTVYSDGNVRISELGISSNQSYFGNEIEIEVTNKPQGEEFRIYKKDKEGTPLSGAIFKATKQGGDSKVVESTSDENGVVKFDDLDQGTYIIEETKAPEGYKKNNKKWVLVIDENGSKVYNYRESSESTINSIIEKPGVNWVDVANRDLSGWNLYDNRRTGWAGNYPQPYKLGTRIVAINRSEKYFIQRFVINPEAMNIDKTTATIHREKPEYPNMDWYKGDETYQVFELNKPVTENNISSLRLAEYGAKDITSTVGEDTDTSFYGQPPRLKLNLPATNKPLVVDIKVPYKSEYGGVGLGMDWTQNNTTYWKSDFYERADIIKEASQALPTNNQITGSYISDDSLDVENEAKTYGFKIKKVQETNENKTIEGATFKLTGPGTSTTEKLMTTGKGGTISFDNLKPGIYKLEEENPAPGYEKTDASWTITVTRDGKVYYRLDEKDQVNKETIVETPITRQARSEDLVLARLFMAKESYKPQPINLLELAPQRTNLANPLMAVAQSPWEIVDGNSKTQPTTRQDTSKSDYGQLIETKIIEIDKANNRYKQVFIYRPDGTVKRNRNIKFHRAYDSYGISTNEVTTRVYQVPNGTSLQNINESSDIDKIDGKTDISSNVRFTQESPNKIQTDSITTKYPGTILIEVETNYRENQPIGLGSNYNSNKSVTWGNQTWMEKSYANEASVPVVKSTVYHKISFEANGGAWKMDPVEVEDNTTYTLPGSSFIPPTGKEFDGWLVNGQKKNPGDRITVTSDLTLTAQWKDPQATISFEANGGQWHMNPVKVDKGSQYTLPGSSFIPPTGKEFDGWLVNGQKKNPGDRITVTGDLTLTAQWKDPAPTEVTINFSPGDGSGQMASQTIKPGNFTLPNPTFTPPEGKEFAGWLVDDQVIKPNTEINVTKDLTITAQWKEPATYNVLVSSDIKNGTISVNPSQARAGEPISFTIKPDEGYKLGKIDVKDSNGDPLEVSKDEGIYTFTMPSSDVTISANFLDELTPQDEDKLIKEGDFALISNKQTGLDLKIYKKDTDRRSVKGGEFTLKKTTDDTYEKIDPSFKALTATAVDEGRLVFNNDEGKTLNLKPGYYILEEKSAPSGYVKARAPWKIHVYEQNGQLKADYLGPEDTQFSYITSDKALDKTEDKVLKTATNGIKYAARMTYINTESKTYIQRIYLDTRNYNGSDKVNVQITPKVKRKEIDSPGETPKTIEEGVKTAYRSTYKLSGIGGDPTASELNNIFRNYNISRDNVSVVNTARWRPFDWGFDEDQLNLDKGVYYIDVEGFYDDNITKEDIGKIEMNLDFYDGERSFQQATGRNESGNIIYSKENGGSYQEGNEQIGYGPDEAEGQAQDGKYPNWLSKKGGRIYPELTNPSASVTTSIGIRSLYSSGYKREIPSTGMEIINEEESYNITFSKHGRLNENEDINGEDITKRRLEGAVFSLQQQIGSTFVDVPDSHISSAFNGYFGFRNLKPGRYRLMEVKAPEGYKPIDGPLLHFTVETIKTNSGEMVDPETGDIVNIKNIKVNFNNTPTILSELYMEDPADKDKLVQIKNVDSSKINLDTQIYQTENKTDGKALKDLSIVGTNTDEDGKLKEYPISQSQIIPKSSGYISLEYDKANKVFQYVPEKSSSEKDGKLVDFVTSATAKNMGKIINEKPDRGSLELKKVDDNGKSLSGAEFKLTDITTGKTIGLDGKAQDNKASLTVGNDGILKVENLEIGSYRLVETKSPEGHINTDQEWNFTIGGKGLDPYFEDSFKKTRDISKYITLADSKLDVLSSDKTDIIYPNANQSLVFRNKFKLSDIKINPGDFFTVKLSENLDLNGVLEEDPSGLDIVATGVGTIAKGEYNEENHTITYTFTNYAKTYDFKEFKKSLRAFINRKTIKENSNAVSVGLGIEGQSLVNNNIEVSYDLKTSRAEDETNSLSLDSGIASFSPSTGEFVHYYYINRDATKASGPVDFTYTPDRDIDNLNIRLYKADKKNMPSSFDVDENSIEDLGIKAQRTKLDKGSSSGFTFEEGINEPYLVKVTGKLSNSNESSYIGYAKLVKPYKDKEDLYVERKDEIYSLKDKASASKEMTFDAVNPANKIVYKKVDTDGRPLEGAKFDLEIKSSDQWIPHKKDITTGEDGLIKLKALKEGSYRLREITPPTDYKLSDKLNYFRVDKTGKIFRYEPDQGGYRASQKEIQEPGLLPNLVINKKIYKIKFKKTDENGQTPLKGAEFKIWYKETKGDTYGTGRVILYENKVTNKKIVLKSGDNPPKGFTQVENQTLISDENGSVGFEFYDSGYYALKEIKAPSGYIKPKGFVKEFAAIDGKVKEKTRTETTIRKLENSTDPKEVEFTFHINTDKKPITYYAKEDITGAKLSTLKLYMDDNRSIFNNSNNIKAEVYKDGKPISLNTKFSKDYRYFIIDLYEAVNAMNQDSSTTTTASKEPITSSDTITIKVTAALADSMFNATTGNLKEGIKLSQTLKLAKADYGKDLIETRTIPLSSKEDGTTIDSYEEIKDSQNPIPIKNTKAVYPFTGSAGVWIGFAILGVILMTLAGIYLAMKGKEKKTV